MDLNPKAVVTGGELQKALGKRAFARTGHLHIGEGDFEVGVAGRIALPKSTYRLGPDTLDSQALVSSDGSTKARLDGLKNRLHTEIASTG